MTTDKARVKLLNLLPLKLLQELSYNEAAHHHTTESIRRTMIETGQPYDDLKKVQEATQRWTTDELRQEFDVLGFLAPYVVVRRKSDGARGTVEFTHSPRVYFNFVEE